MKTTPASCLLPAARLNLHTTAHVQISPAGVALVKHFESLYLQAYQDEAGVWTIGYGHTGLQHNDGTVYAGRRITEDEAEDLLRYDMHQFERRVSALVQTELSQWQFDALVSFDFNTGGLTLERNEPSTLLRELNASREWEAALQFGQWIKAGGRILKGLVRRRNAERDMFCGFGWEQWKS